MINEKPKKRELTAEQRRQLDAIVRRLKGKYWHRLTDKEIQELIDAKITYDELAETVKQPTWCQYPDALKGIMGCWSLTGSARKKISHKFCKGCDCYKSA